MALPIVITELPPEACKVLQAAISPTILLPGGVAIQGIAGTDTGDPSKIVRSLLQAANPALAPFMPLFDIVEAILSIAKMGEATIPPNPVAFGEALATLVEKAIKLAALVPQAAVPNLAKSVVDTIVAGLLALRSQLGAMLAYNQRLVEDELRAATLPEPARTALTGVLACARGNLEIQLANENKAMEPLNRLIATVNALLELVKLPCIPIVGGVDLDPGVLAILDDVIAILRALSAAIPSASFELPGLPPAGEC
jgi:hypothetical protein